MKTPQLSINRVLNLLKIGLERDQDRACEKSNSRSAQAESDPGSSLLMQSPVETTGVSRPSIQSS